MKIKKAKSRIKTSLSCLIALVCLAGAGYSGYKIISWLIDSNSVKTQTKNIEKVAQTIEVPDSDKTEIVPSENNNDYYHKYLTMKLLNVDLGQLKNINPDAAGWISVSGTDINYPFVQTTNNDYYLKHSFDKSYNSAGWVFADFRNKLDGDDKNLILYAHGRYDGTMFGTLRNILKSNWLKQAENFTVRTVTTKESQSWQVFSVYHIPVTTDYIQTDFSNEGDFRNLVELLKKRSAYNFNTEVSNDDHILTLSTCYSNSERVVLHAKLIKHAQR